MAEIDYEALWQGACDAYEDGATDTGGMSLKEMTVTGDAAAVRFIRQAFDAQLAEVWTWEAEKWVELATKVVERDATIAQMSVALHDAINRPKGVVPASAEPFYNARTAIEGTNNGRD